jgi:Tol biopolymer transport system component/DNA-binding SARP family transcriptional activator
LDSLQNHQQRNVLRVHTLGRLHVRAADGPVSGSAAQPRRLAILALLAAAGEQGVTREKVMAYLWPETEEERARRSLNQAIYSLRHDLGSEDMLLGTRDLRLNSGLVSSDLAEFEQALAEGRLEDAEARYTGPFLDGFHLPGAAGFERWAEEERAELTRRYAELLERLGRRSEERRDYKEAVRWWRKRAAQDPLNARVAKVLMQALLAAGDRAGALQHARIYEALVEQELDLPPDREVTALAAELRRAETEDGTLPEPVTRAASASAPDVGSLVTDATPPGVPALERPAAATEIPPSSPAPVLHTIPERPKRRLPALSRVAAVLLVLALGAGGLLLRRGAPSALVPGTTHRVAFADVLELHPAISADGKMVAYTAAAGDRTAIFVRQVRGGRAVPVTEELPGSHWLPKWSPDGTRIAFQSQGLIYEVPAFGGAPRPLVRPSAQDRWVASPAWSPDGARIAYVENWAIHVRPVAGAPAKLITERLAVHSLAWSPDGEWIAFVSGNPTFISGESPWGSATNLGNIAPSSIWVVRARGGAPVQVTDARSLNTSPVWLPKGRALLFVSNREGSRDIYRVNLGASGTPAGQPVRLTTGLSAHTFSLSGDGAKLAYSVFTSTGNVWTVDIPEGEPVSVAEATPLTEGTQVIEGVSLSPVGRWLAFDSDRNGNQDVYKVPLDGGEPVQLTRSPDDDFVSSWSGDGREIAIHSYHAGTRRVRIISADGGEPRDIVGTPPNQRSPGLAPDGRSLVFTSDASGQLQLYLVVRNGSSWGAARQLTSKGGWGGRWAPDGHAIVYCRQDGVWLIGPDGGSPTQLVTIESSTGLPAPELAQWSPDSRTIYYKAFDAAGHSSLWSVPAVGGIPRLLVRLDDPSRPSPRPEFATDGKRFFFTIGTRQSDIWVMELRAQR